MQTDSQSSSTVSYILQAVGYLLAGGVGSLITSFANRRKVAPEIEGIAARADLDRAQARRFDSQTVDAAYERIDELTVIIGELREVNMRLQGVEVENKILVAWNTRMKALLKANGLKVPSKWESVDS